MYYVEEISSGWAIFFKDDWVKKSFIAGHLSSKQANKWCDRLNDAYKKGVASQW